MRVYPPDEDRDEEEDDDCCGVGAFVGPLPDSGSAALDIPDPCDVMPCYNPLLVMRRMVEMTSPQLPHPHE